jgi:hypothetical protein
MLSQLMKTAPSRAFAQKWKITSVVKTS